MSIQIRIPRATKIELLRLKKRLRLAEKLKGLLTDRMTILLQELYAVTIRALKLRRKLNQLLLDSYPGFLEAYTTRGMATLEATSKNIPEPRVKTLVRNVMGVQLPIVELEDTDYEEKTLIIELSQLSRLRKEILETLIELAEAEKSMEIIAGELARTRRKVEALDKILIPRLSSLIKSLEMKFEEMEREERVRSIKVKRLLELKHSGVRL